MAEHNSRIVTPRRSFLARLGAGLGVFGAASAGEQAAQAQTGGARWQPARHAQDDWLDQLPGGHRFVIDTTLPAGLESAVLYATNFYAANQSGYGLGNADAAVVIVMRHLSTPFGYNNAMWKKYGAALSRAINFTDPKTKQAPTTNVRNAEGDGMSIDSLAKRGVQFAVCQMATKFFAGQLAQAIGASADDVYTEVTMNLVPNAHIVAAGIVAVNRAQERGYALATVL
jgi:intracellular sulfur oxidation DsrE/DsrF family protein